MQILIDGDGCPVIQSTIDIARRYNVEVIIMCDTSHSFDKYDVKVITMSKGADSVDFKIVNEVKKDDIVITQDYGLATMLLAKEANIINQNGLIYSNENIDMLLFNRYLSRKIRNSGLRTKGPKKRTKEDNTKFEVSLEKLIKEII